MSKLLIRDCPHCQRPLAFLDGRTGHPGRCGHCQETFLLKDRRLRHGIQGLVQASAAIAILGLGGYATGAFDPVPDDVANDSIAARQLAPIQLESNLTLTHGIDHTRDQDWFQIGTEGMEQLDVVVEAGDVVAEIVTVDRIGGVHVKGSSPLPIDQTDKPFLRVSGRDGSVGPYRVVLRNESPRGSRHPRVLDNESRFELNGRVGLGDPGDSVLVTIPESGRIAVSLEGRARSPEGLRIRVEDPQGNELANSELSEGKAAFSVSMDGSTAARIAIDGAPDTAMAWDYLLAVRWQSDDFADTPSAARALAADSNGFASIDGQLEAADDVDVFEYRPVADGRVSVRLENGFGFSDLVLSILDKDGTVLRQVDDGLGGESSVVSVRQDESIWIAASMLDEAASSYSLTVSPYFGGAGVGDAATAVQLVPDADGRASATGSISTPGVWDRYSYTAPVAGYFVFKVTPTIGFPRDWVLRHLDESGDIERVIDRDPSQGGESWAIRLASGAEVMLDLAPFGAGTGAYLLTVSPEDQGFRKLEFGDKDDARATASFTPFEVPDGYEIEATRDCRMVIEVSSDILAYPPLIERYNAEGITIERTEVIETLVDDTSARLAFRVEAGELIRFAVSAAHQVGDYEVRVRQE